MRLSDTRFLLALTAAAAPVAGHASVAPAAPEEMQRLETSALFRAILYAWVPLQLGLIVWGSSLIGKLEGADAVLLTLSVGLATGATGITIAHELGHKRPALDRFLSRLLLVTVSYGHFTVEHNRGHHVRVATPEDPASARYGESFWRFLPRTLMGSFKDAYRMDPSEVTRVWVATFAVAATLGLAFGPLAVAFFFGQSAMAVTLLEAVNYVEHYGLERRKLSDGRYERQSARHAWDAYEVLSNSFLVHLQRHADHHLNPMRPYAALQPQEESPKLPAGYAGMVPIALVPPLWFAVMNPRVPRG